MGVPPCMVPRRGIPCGYQVRGAIKTAVTIRGLRHFRSLRTYNGSAHDGQAHVSQSLLMKGGNFNGTSHIRS